MQCFRSFHTPERAIKGIEAMHAMRKGPLGGAALVVGPAV
jgi:hypothetical protein